MKNRKITFRFSIELKSSIYITLGNIDVVYTFDHFNQF